MRVSGALSEGVDEYLESVLEVTIFLLMSTCCLYVDIILSILEVGVDEMSWDDMHKNDMVWPTVEEVICSWRASLS